MARYTWGYDDTVFHSLAEVKAALEDLVGEFLEKRYLELIYRGEHAEYEVDVTVKLRPH